LRLGPSLLNGSFDERLDFGVGHATAPQVAFSSDTVQPTTSELAL
jgi:hypothetical protein